MNKNKLVRSIMIDKERHFVIPRGFGRGWGLACTNQRVARRDIKEVRAYVISCYTCQEEVSKRNK
jgi:hypothetical protein